MANSDQDSDILSREEVIEALDTTSEHPESSHRQLAANRQVLRGIGHQEMKLEDELANLRKSIDSYKKWSKWLTITLIFLSVVLAILSGAQLFVLLS